MKARLTRGAVMTAVLLMLSVGIARAEPEGQFLYNLALRPAADSLSPAIDFNFRYEVADEGEGWHHFNAGFWFQGAQAFSDQITDVDHMEIGADLFGSFYSTEMSPLPGPAQDYYRSLFEKSGAGVPLTDEEDKELGDLTKDFLNSHNFVGYLFNVKLVTDQETVNKLVTGGLGVQAELSALARLFDAPFAPTRGAHDPFAPPPVTLSLAGEYVSGLNNRDEEYPQIAGSVKWETRVLDRLYPGIKWNGSYASDEETRPDFVSFLDASVVVPFTAQTSVAFGYLVGRVAPNYEYVRGLRLGFDVSNW